jgi:hypothetical protein
MGFRNTAVANAARTMTPTKSFIRNPERTIRIDVIKPVDTGKDSKSRCFLAALPVQGVR